MAFTRLLMLMQCSKSPDSLNSPMVHSVRFTTLCFVTLFHIVGLFSVHVGAQPTNEGWHALQNNDLQEAQRLLRLAVANNPNDSRAWFGLTFEANLRSDDALAWEAFKHGMGAVPDPKPYIYSSLATSRFAAALANPASGAADLLRQVVGEPDLQGSLTAMAYERLGALMEKKERVGDARALYDKIGALTTWRLVGPFDNISGSGFAKVFPPEHTDDTNAVYKNASGGMIKWQTPIAQRLDAWIDFTYFSSDHRGQFYSVAYVKSDKKQRVEMRLGTSGSFKLFVNDSVIRQEFEERNNDLDTYITECWINEGWNKILVKIGASELNRCNFLLRITDVHGMPIDGLTVSTRQERYSALAPEPRSIENANVAFFSALISKHPQFLENYLFLAETHLRNDEANEAIAILRKARSVAPGCLLIDVLLLEAYNRSGRTDDYSSLMEHLSVKAPTLPLSILYRYSIAVSQDRTDEADSILEVIRSTDSSSMTFFDAAMPKAKRNSDIQLFTSLVKQAFLRYPEAFQYAAMYAALVYLELKSAEDASTILNKHLAENATHNGLEALAGLYSNDGNMSALVATYERLLALVPPGSRIHASLCDVYITRNDWNEALASINRAIAIAPNIGWYWYKRGIVKKNLGRMIEATADLQQALAIDPSNFEARAFIRELQGKPHPFTYIHSEDIDSVIRNAPQASAFPNASSIYLCDSKKRVVYEGSNCEVQYEWVARVFTTSGIDYFKEVHLMGNGSNIIEKAVVRKPDGKEIPADNLGNQLVFKGIEPGDFIHVRYRFIEAEHGRLGQYFSDAYSFNGTLPQLHSVYALLAPEGTPYQWLAYGLSSEMVVTKHAFGELATWETRNEPAIDYEEGMPSLDDIDKRVEVSSIPNWEEIISWYYDISHSKTRHTAEVGELMDSLFPRTQTYSREEIIAGVYRFVTKEIRYSYVSFRQSGYVPQKADRVLNTRIGDCKDVSTLCISMLAERGITSHYILVKTNTSPFQRKTLPGIPFDHVIVTIPGDSLPSFLDLTADYVPIGSVPEGDRNAMALVIRPGLRAPNYLSKQFFRPNTHSVETDVTIKVDLSALITQTFVVTGAGTQYYRAAWKERTTTERDKGIVEMLSEEFPNVELLSVDVDDLDPLRASVRYTISYFVPNYVMEAGGFLIAPLPWDRPLVPMASLSYDKRHQPLDASFFIDSTTETIRMNVPSGYVMSAEKGTESISVPQTTYVRHFTSTPSMLTATRQVSNNKRVVLPEEYVSYKTEYNRMVKEDRRSVLFMPKGTIVKIPKRSSR